MRKLHVFIAIGVMLLLFPLTTWASDPLNVSEETPDILASLNQADVTPLDDAALTEIRGQNGAPGPVFRMVRLFPLNAWDRKGFGDWEFTGNLFDWAYGNFGGIEQIGAGGPPIDGMDYLFALHDLGVGVGGISDAGLAAGLSLLPRPFSYGVWGQVYQPEFADLPPASTIFGAYSDYTDHYDWTVRVHRISVLSYGGRFFWGRQLMPLTEYARRQAFIAMSFLSILGL